MKLVLQVLLFVISGKDADLLKACNLFKVDDLV